LRYQAASLALGATVVLTSLKLVAAGMSHSVGVLSEGIHSFLDLVSAGISFFSVREAGKPADAEHPFGHGKIETLSSFFEALLLIFAAGLIFYEGIEHLRHPHLVVHQTLAMGVILISIVVSYWVYVHNGEAASLTESSALRVNALHFFSDVISSVGVLVGLILLKWTGLLWIDSVIAFIVAIYILAVTWPQIKAVISELTDVQLPQHEIDQILTLLNEFSGRSIDAHDLRTRKSGATRHIDFHLVVCGQMTVEQSHAVCDQIEEKLNTLFFEVSVNIHVEPCEKEKTQCHVICPAHLKKQAQTN
jgi:cation diffusion facilitator family transporter